MHYYQSQEKLINHYIDGDSECGQWVQECGERPAVEHLAVAKLAGDSRRHGFRNIQEEVQVALGLIVGVHCSAIRHRERVDTVTVTTMIHKYSRTHVMSLSESHQGPVVQQRR